MSSQDCNEIGKEAKQWASEVPKDLGCVAFKSWPEQLAFSILNRTFRHRPHLLVQSGLLVARWVRDQKRFWTKEGPA